MIEINKPWRHYTEVQKLSNCIYSEEQTTELPQPEEVEEREEGTPRGEDHIDKGREAAGVGCQETLQVGLIGGASAAPSQGQHQQEGGIHDFIGEAAVEQDEIPIGFSLEANNLGREFLTEVSTQL